MEEKNFSYKSDEIEVRYDINRCIHAEECVKGLRTVFNPDQKPWIQPEHGSVDDISQIIEQCPTGALQYRRKDSQPNEQKPQKNTISVIPDGPVYIRGDVEIHDHEGNVLLSDSRFALCRCGKSKQKPACDNSHVASNFEATSAINKSSLHQGKADDGQPGKLLLKLMNNGPVLVEGTYEIYSETSQPTQCSKNIALCRCGESANKPFCDGSHKEAGFKS